MVLKLKGCQAIIVSYAGIGKHESKMIQHNYRGSHLSQVMASRKSFKVLKNKIDKLVTWYDEFTGMDEVREAQRRVLEDEQNFRKAQEERRRVLNQLNDVQAKIKELYAELDTTNRGDDRYVFLVTEEHKMLKEEKAILEKFSLAEKDERDFFAALSSSVKLSHEKERAQGERTKYWSIIGSVLGTVIGILGTSLNNHFKMSELKDLIKNSPDKALIEHVLNYLESNEKIISKLQENESSNSKVEELLNNLVARVSSVEVNLKNLEQSDPNISNFQIVSDSEKAYRVMVPIETLTETVKKDYTHTKIMFCTLVVLSVIMPLIVKFN